MHRNQIIIVPSDKEQVYCREMKKQLILKKIEWENKNLNGDWRVQKWH